MPLSDREKHMLNLIESGLRADDPKFASRVQRGSVRSPRSRRRRRGVTLFVVGLLMLVTGVAVRATMIDGFPILSVLGFTVMFGGAIVAVVGSNADSDRADTAPGPGR
jgi:hypothetical protein